MKNNFLKIFLGISLVFAVFVFTNVSHAALGSSFVVDLQPKYPAPGGQVTVTLRSYSFDVSRSEIVWLIDSKQAASGVGVSSFNFIAPQAGKNLELFVYVSPPDKSQLSQKLLLAGNNVDLLWESDGYVPVWYKGKSLTVQGSSLKISAIPSLYLNGKKILANELVYVWTVDNEGVLGASGYGKQIFRFKPKSFKGGIVAVRISDRENNVVFEKAIAIQSNNALPQVLLYEEDLVDGLRSNKTLSEQTDLSQKGEIIIRAEPYFFSSQSLSSLSYNWTMNGKVFGTDKFPNVVSLRAGEQSGATDMDLYIKNPRQFVQYAKNALRISF